MKKSILKILAIITIAAMLPIRTQAASYKKDGSAVVMARADATGVVKADYKVLLDPYLKLEWEKGDSYVGEYKAGVMGTLPKGVVVSVRPDENFVVKSEETKFRGHVEQEKYYWLNKDFSAKDQGVTDNLYKNALEVSDKRAANTYGKAWVEIPSEGHFEGEISFTFRMEKMK